MGSARPFVNDSNANLSPFPRSEQCIVGTVVGGLLELTNLYTRQSMPVYQNPRRDKKLPQSESMAEAAEAGLDC